jgi:hypothetical protein
VVVDESVAVVRVVEPMAGGAAVGPDGAAP